MSTQLHTMKENRKLDNRRIECDIRLVILRFFEGYKRMEVNHVHAKRMSGYCLDVNNDLSISIKDVGRLLHVHGDSGDGWEVTCFDVDVDKASKLIKAEALRHCNKLEKHVKRIRDALMIL